MNSNQIKECAIIIGTYINAYSIYRSLKAIKYKYPIIAIETQTEKAKCLSEILTGDVKIIKKVITNPMEIIPVINEILDKNTTKYIFFTSEEYIDTIKQGTKTKELENVVAYTGARNDNGIIFDRYRFYQFIEERDLAYVPRTINGTENPIEEFGNTFIIRPKRSWEENIRTPRLSIVHGLVEKEKTEGDFRSLGMMEDMWCYQELLSTDDRHNVSVCGWYDNDFEQFAVTRKLVQHPPKTGNGDVVEIFDSFPLGLVKSTRAILQAVEYAGPFEMEYVYDLNSRQYKVIELNPRYWMQHELVGCLTDHSLIRRNLGQILVNSKAPEFLPHRYWVNTNQMLYRLLKGQWEMFHYLSNSIKAPGFLNTIRWLPYYREYKNNLG